tara:strand:+ start:240 stop:554 length:315 start_codon:yes stop_codon:yes gene_type:complete
MAVYKNITSVSTGNVGTVLIAKNGNVSSNISKITVSNNSANTATVRVYLGEDNANTTDFYFIKGVEIPTASTLVLSDNLKFDKNRFNLIIHNAGTSPDLTVIVK